MAVRNRVPAADPRTPDQKKADEAIAGAAESGHWDGLEMTALCTVEGARQIVEHRRTLDPGEMRAQVTKHPFRWKDRVFRILRCEFADGEAHVEVAPNEPEFVAEVKNRLEANRFHVLPYYQGFGFLSFPEDYLRYQD
jgi:hypothetical protein